MTATALRYWWCSNFNYIRNSRSNYQLGDVLLIDSDDLGVGSGGSGFQYTLNSNNTGIATVSNISLNGAGYAM